jgi:hypothetical protein
MMANTREGTMQLKNSDRILAEWIRLGIVIPSRGEKKPLPVSPVKIADGTARRLLRRDRNDKRS